jgi:hypothetical protein
MIGLGIRKTRATVVHRRTVDEEGKVRVARKYPLASRLVIFKFRPPLQCGIKTHLVLRQAFWIEWTHHRQILDPNTTLLSGQRAPTHTATVMIQSTIVDDMIRVIDDGEIENGRETEDKMHLGLVTRADIENNFFLSRFRVKLAHRRYQYRPPHNHTYILLVA